MDVPFGGALRSSPDHRGPCQIALADIEAWRDANPAEIGEAPGLHGDVREPRRFPESHRNPDARQRICAGTDRRGGVGGGGPAAWPALPERQCVVSGTRVFVSGGHGCRRIKKTKKTK